MAGSAQAILDTIAAIEAVTSSESAASNSAAKSKYTPKLPGPPPIQDLLRETLASDSAKKLAAHPDFPALSKDGGVQALVSAMTNQVGHLLNSIRGSGHDNQTTLGD